MHESSCIVRVKREAAVYRLVLRDPRTPRVSKYLLGIALLYLVTPVDLVPDFIPVVGWVDDLVIVPLLVLAARSSIPRGVFEDCRAQLARNVPSETAISNKKTEPQIDE